MNIRLLTIFFFLILLSITTISGQTLSTQAEVDAWDQSITDLTQFVTIQGDDITNIDALSSLTTISGSLEIIGNPILVNIDGLASVTSLTGSLHIGEFNNTNDALSNINGLSSLNAISGELVLTRNPALANIDGLSSVNSISGILKVNQNRALLNIDGLSNLSSLTGKLTIDDNDHIINIDGLLGLTAISGDLRIANNRDFVTYDGLSNIDGLANITSIPGRLNLINNDIKNVDALSKLTSLSGGLEISNHALLNIDGLSNLSAVSGFLEISNSDSLKNINALSNLNSFSGSIVISDNSVLTNINGLSNLSSIPGRLLIDDNDSLDNIDGLSNLTSISGELILRNNNSLLDIDVFSDLDTIAGILTIEENESLVSVFSSVKSISGEIIIDDNDALVNIDGLSNLNSIVGSLELKNNDALTNTDGLLGLVSLSGSLIIEANSTLSNIDGLSNLALLESSGSLDILDNPTLANLDGFSNLISIQGTLELKNNDALVNTDGLLGLVSLPGWLTIEANSALVHIDGLGNLSSLSGGLIIETNPSLSNLNGLSHMTTISGTLVIEGNASLSNLDSFINLESVSLMTIGRNASLTNLDGLTSLDSIGRVTIEQNDALTSIDGLSNLSFIGSLRIVFNSNLSDCCILRLPIREGESIYLQSNAVGCKSKTQVAESSDCGLSVNFETNPPCVGQDNGIIKLYASNYDTLPFNYMWQGANSLISEGESQEDIICIDDLAADTYSVTVTQPNGDKVVLTDLLLDPIDGSVFEILGLTSVNSVNGFPSGILSLEWSGGAAPYEISWSGVASGSQENIGNRQASIQGLKPGEYSITIIDINGQRKVIQTTLLDEIVPVFPCNEPLDIVILNDVSGSVDAVEYLESQAFFVDFLRAANIGEAYDQSQAAIIEWSDSESQDVKISLTGNLLELELYKEKNRSFSGSTSPHPAMQVGADYLAQNGRADVEKVIVLSTDGSASESLVSLADELKAKGYHIITIAFDGAYRSSGIRNLLREVASLDLLAPGAPSYSELDSDLAESIVNLYLCPLDPGSSATVYFNRDGAITIDSIESTCPVSGLVELTFTVSADRELSIPSGTSVMFYHNNPTLFGATPITNFLIPCAIGVGESETFQISLPISTATNLYALLNDDGHLNPPLQFPITDLEEIAYSNNIDSIEVCIGLEPTVQALKYTSTPDSLCDNLMIYTIDVCNISQLDAEGITVQDLPPSGATLNAINVNTNGCSTDNNGSYDIPAGCCVSLTLFYDATDVTPDYYGDQGVIITGPAGQEHINYDGAQSSAEDITVESGNCDAGKISLEKAVNVDEICEDGFLEYTFYIDNDSDFVLQGVQFSDIIPSPMEWIFRPYALDQLSITAVELSGTTASFLIDEVPARTRSSFKIDAYTGDWAADGVVNNVAKIDRVIDPSTGTLQSLESNSVSTRIIANVDVLEMDTIFIAADLETVDIAALGNLSTAVAQWTTVGDGSFENSTAVSTVYHFGSEDKLDTLVTLFFSASSTCEEIGKPLYIKRFCNLSFDPVQTIAVCYGSSAKTMLSWNGGIGPYQIEELAVDTIRADSVDLNDIPQGTHVYTLEDSFGCVAEIELTVESSDGIEELLLTLDHVDCLSPSSGILIDEVKGGTPSYSYYINNELVSPDQMTNLIAGSYLLTVRDSLGCDIDTLVTLEPPNEISGVLITLDEPDCFGEENGSIIIEDVVGGTPNYEYFMDDEPMGLDELTSLKAGAYGLTIRDSMGCELDTIITLDQNEAIFLEADLTVEAVMVGDDLLLELSTNISTEQIDTVMWLPNIPCDNCLEYLIEDVQEDQYYAITVIDENGCEASLDFRFEVETELSIYIPNIINSHLENESSFFPQSGNDGIIVEEMSIYDRWGNLVFEKNEFPINDGAYGWDGTLNGGKVEIGVYTYAVTFRYNNITSSEVGNVTVLR